MEVPYETITLGLIWFVVFLFSTTCHEGAHALAARWGGDPTASNQVTLNPLPHVLREPFGMVVIPILSFVMGGYMIGWASTPYDPTWSYRHPHRAARMALAGPLANFTLMLAAAFAIRVGVAAGFFRPPSGFGFTFAEAADPTGIGVLLASFLSITFFLNLILGTFNLLPVPPLDGHAGVTILLPEDKARSFLDLFRKQEFAWMGLLIAWALYYRISPYILGGAMKVLYFLS